MVSFHQFLKGRETSETKFFLHLKELGFPVEMTQCGTPDFIMGKPSPDDVARSLACINRIEEFFNQCSYVCQSQTPKECSINSYNMDKEASSTVSECQCSCPFDVFVLDELMTCIDLGIVSSEDVLKLIEKKPTHVELIITGRCTPEKAKDLIASPLVGLVTEMKEIRHYYNEQKLQARVGIEM